jgi:hypothetical protein
MDQVQLTKQSITMKLKKNMKTASDLMSILGKVMHEGNRMSTKTTSDVKHAIILNARANFIGASKSSFIPDLSFQP